MWGVVLSLIAAATPAVSIVAPTDTSTAVQARVEREVGPVTWRDADADLALVIEPEASSWRLQIREGDAVLERRTIDATDRGAAIRVTALLLVDAMDRWTPPPTPPEPEAPPAWRAAIAVEGVTWIDPFTPQPGVSLALVRRFEALSLGARVGWRRWCCGVATADIEADAHTLSLLAEIAVELARSDAWRFGIAGGLGAAYDRVEAFGIFPGGRGPPELTTDWHAAGRATGWAGIELGGVDLRLAVGIWVQGDPVTVELPEPFDDATPLARGVVSPYLALEAGLSL